MDRVTSLVSSKEVTMDRHYYSIYCQQTIFYVCMHDHDKTSDMNNDKQSSAKLIIIRKQDEAFVTHRVLVRRVQRCT